MTGHANPQRLVDAAVGVRKLDVEYVDSVAECHKLFATGRYAGIPASISMEREPDPLTAGVAQDQEAGLSSTGMVSIRRDVLDGTLKGGEGDGGIIMRPLPDTPCIRHWRPRASTNSAPSSRGIRNRRHRSHGHGRTAPVLCIGLCPWTHIGNRDAILSGKTRRTILKRSVRNRRTAPR